MTPMPTAYPLQWPAGWPRTSPGKRQKSAFEAGRGASFGKSLKFLQEELRRLGARSVVISTNQPLRRDGLPFATRREPDDPGIAAYFNLKGGDRCIPCDRWRFVADNLHAVALSIAALRGLERWGAGKMVEAAFAGFKALPGRGESTGRSWWHVLEVDPGASLGVIDEAYRQRARTVHPDAGGDLGEWYELQEALRQAKQARGGA